MIIRVPRLSELNFSADLSNQLQEPYIKFQKDLSYTHYSSTGKITLSQTGDKAGLPVSFKSADDSVTAVSRTGRYTVSSLSFTGAKVIAGVPTLKRKISLPLPDSAVLNGYMNGTLGKYFIDIFDGLVSGKNPSDETKEMFATRDDDNGIYTWNQDCWAWPVDLTCMAPWRDGGGEGSSPDARYFWPVTAITPRHIVCGHVGTWVGEKYHFFTRENEIIEREVVAKKAFTTAYYVGLLDEDLPNSIIPAKLLPDGVDLFGKYLPSTEILPIPVIATDQQKKALSNAIFKLNSNKIQMLSTGPYHGNAFSEEIIGGDSSSPFLLR